MSDGRKRLSECEYRKRKPKEEEKKPTDIHSK
jgi:hypothetical protein